MSRTMVARPQGENVIFTPVKVKPTSRNFFYVETQEELAYNEESQSYVTQKVTGVLFLQKGEHAHSLGKKSRGSLEEVLKAFEKVILQRCLKM